MKDRINRLNYLDVQKFLDHLTQVERLSQDSVSRYRSYLKHLLLWAMDTPLQNAQKIQPGFITYLEDYVSEKTGRSLSRESWRKTLGITARFFNWAISTIRTRYSQKLQSYIATLVVPPTIQDDIDINYVTEEEIRMIARLEIPEENLALRRDQAAACFLYCSGMRVGAFVTMPIMAFDSKILTVKQWAKLGVKTKNGKQITSFLYEIPELIAKIRDWDEFINSVLYPADAWYPRIDNHWGDQRFSQKPLGNNRDKSVNKRLKRLFNAAGLESKSAHDFRRGHVVAGMKRCEDMATFKAISENLGHANTTITDQYYGRIKPDDRREKIANLFKETGDK